MLGGSNKEEPRPGPVQSTLQAVAVDHQHGSEQPAVNSSPAELTWQPVATPSIRDNGKYMARDRAIERHSGGRGGTKDRKLRRKKGGKEKKKPHDVATGLAPPVRTLGYLEVPASLVWEARRQAVRMQKHCQAGPPRGGESGVEDWGWGKYVLEGTCGVDGFIRPRSRLEASADCAQVFITMPTWAQAARACPAAVLRRRRGQETIGVETTDRRPPFLPGQGGMRRSVDRTLLHPQTSWVVRGPRVAYLELWCNVG